MKIVRIVIGIYIEFKRLHKVTFHKVTIKLLLKYFYEILKYFYE